MHNSQYENTTRIEAVKIIRTGKRGRPQKIIQEEVIRNMMSAHREISTQELANLLGVSISKLQNSMREYGIEKLYGGISNEDLDTLFREFKKEKPTSGRRYFHGYVRSKGYRVKRKKIIESMKRVDPRV